MPWTTLTTLRHYPMCARTILPACVAKHPRCAFCTILLEPEFNEKTLCRCGKYHNAPSEIDPAVIQEQLGNVIGHPFATA